MFNPSFPPSMLMTTMNRPGMPWHGGHAVALTDESERCCTAPAVAAALLQEATPGEVHCSFTHGFPLLVLVGVVVMRDQAQIKPRAFILTKLFEKFWS